MNKNHHDLIVRSLLQTGRGLAYSLFQVRISTVKREVLPGGKVWHKGIQKRRNGEQIYYDDFEEFRCWITGTMHLFGKICFPHPIIRSDGIKKTTRKGEEMFEGHYRLCRFETCFLCRGFIDDNGVAKFGEVVTHRGVESDLSLFDQFQGSQLKRTRWISSGGMRPEDGNHYAPQQSVWSGCKSTEHCQAQFPHWRDRQLH